jgi:hypothetical protein
MTSAESTEAVVPPQIHEALKVIKGQLTDLPSMNRMLARTRLDLRHDIEGLREQVAELPGIRTRLEEQDRVLVGVTDQLATIIGLFAGAPGGPSAEAAG